MSRKFEEKIMREMKYNMKADEYGEDIIFFVGLLVSRKKGQLTPTYILMTNEKKKADETRMRNALRELSGAVAEILKSK